MPVLEQVQTPTPVAFDRIMVAIDLTSTSERALEYAQALAQANGSELHLVYVHDPSKVHTYPEAILGLPAVEGLRQCDEALESLKRSCARAGVAARTTAVEAHSPSAILLKMAHDERVDLLVAGTQSKQGFERILLGSTAERLIREAGCPVLTVGPKASGPAPGPLAFQRILFATDFSPESAMAAAYALALAEKSGSKLHCCYVRTLKSKNAEAGELADAMFKKALEKLMPGSSQDLCRREFVVEHGDAAQAILKVAGDNNIDLIVMGASRPVFWLSQHKTGLSPSILAEATCPVLTCSERCTDPASAPWTHHPVSQTASSPQTTGSFTPKVGKNPHFQ